MITEIIELLQKLDYPSASKAIEFAKGKRELATSFKIAKRKIKRAWQ